jgi:predicted enzyme related to lactoylglutathione lyase
MGALAGLDLGWTTTTGKLCSNELACFLISKNEAVHGVGLLLAESKNPLCRFGGRGQFKSKFTFDYRKYTKYNNGIKGGVYMYKSKVTIWYNVKNSESTLAFYTEKLGFKVFYQNNAAGMVMVKTNSEDCVIGFSEVETVVPSTSSTVFDVENIELAVQTLQQKGVLFNGEIRTIPNITKLATFTEPDGHNLMLSEDLMEF